MLFKFVSWHACLFQTVIHYPTHLPFFYRHANYNYRQLTCSVAAPKTSSIPFSPTLSPTPLSLSSSVSSLIAGASSSLTLLPTFKRSPSSGMPPFSSSPSSVFGGLFCSLPRVITGWIPFSPAPASLWVLSSMVVVAVGRFPTDVSLSTTVWKWGNPL